MTSRRTFLQKSSIGLLGASLPASWSGLSGGATAGLSVQLYTIRDQIKENPEVALRKLASIGFKYVETAFWPDTLKLQDAAALLREFDLKVSSAHIELPLGDQRQLFLDKAKAYGCKKMIWHGWPQDKRYASLEGTRELIGIYQQAHQFARDHGLQFGLHNHWWEYRNQVGGKLVYEILHQELDPDIFFEVDTYWVKVAGQDPAKILSKLGKRVKLLHIKDGPAQYNDKLAEDNPDPMTPVGKGTQDFPAIYKAAGNFPEWWVVEMDKTAIDVYEALKESYAYLVSQKMVRV